MSTKTSRDHKHAYLIMAHTDLELLRRLITLLDDERNDIYLHIDKKWRAFDPSALQTTRAGFFVLPKRIDIRWGHRSIMDVELMLMRSATESGTTYSRYHILSGADLPIKTQDEIHAFFAKYPNEEFVDFWDSPSHIADAIYKTDRYHFGMRYEKGLPY